MLPDCLQCQHVTIFLVQRMLALLSSQVDGVHGGKGRVLGFTLVMVLQQGSP